MLGGQFLDGKLRVLELLEKYDVDTTLLPVLARGVNDDEVGAFVKLALEKDFIRSVELHTMTFTGAERRHLRTRGPLHDLRRAASTSSADRRRCCASSDFVPSPAAHPLCYLVTYVLRLATAAGCRSRAS